MATQRKKITPKKITITKTESASSKIIEVLLLILVIYTAFATYESVINPFSWAFDSRNSAGALLLFGFFILLFFKWK